jgi:hypothetical protein
MSTGARITPATDGRIARWAAMKRATLANAGAIGRRQSGSAELPIGRSPCCAARPLRTGCFMRSAACETPMMAAGEMSAR